MSPADWLADAREVTDDEAADVKAWHAWSPEPRKMTADEVRELAQYHQRHGRHVFPVAIIDNGDGTTSKVPLTFSGFKAATNDPESFEGLMSPLHQPASVKAAGGVGSERVAVGLGWWPGPDGCIVLDVDTKLGATGPEALAKLEAEHGKLPSSSTIHTASGGLHRVFTKDRYVGNDDLAPNVEIRSDAGYVVAPGTVSPWGVWGPLYALDNGDPPEELPAWAYEALGASLAGPEATPERAAAPVVHQPEGLPPGDWAPAVREALDSLRTALVPGQRNTEGTKHAMKLAGYEARGFPGAADAIEVAHEAYVESQDDPKLAEREWTHMIDSGRQKTAQDPSGPSWEEGLEWQAQDQAEFEALWNEIKAGRKATPAQRTAASPLHLPEDFWSARPYLHEIRNAAHSRAISADAVLHVVLARVGAWIPYQIRIPAIVGSPSPLSHFAVILSNAGIGKTTAVRLGVELVPAPFGLEVVDQLPIGSGEGFVESLFEMRGEGKEKEKFQAWHNGFVVADEIETLGKLKDRNGSTLWSTMRSAWSGEVIGQNNAGQATRRVVPFGSYTFGFVTNGQLELMGPVFDDVGAGMPQRFFYAMATDPNIPDEAPNWSGGPLVTGDDLRSIKEVPIAIEPTIARGVRQRKVQRSQGIVEVDPYEAREDLLRLRSAGLLAILDRRHNVNSEDWELAGILVETSRNVRQYTQAAVASVHERTEAATSKRLARRQVESTAAVQGWQIVEAAKTIQKKVIREPGVTVRSLQRRCSRAQREWFSAGLDHAIEQGWVREQPAPGQGEDMRTLWPGAE